MANLLDAGETPVVSIEVFAAASGVSSRTLHRQYGSLENLLRTIHLRRWERQPLPPLAALIAGLPTAESETALGRLIDDSVARLFSAAGRQARRIRAHVLATALYDAELGGVIAAAIDAEHESLARALQEARKRGLLAAMSDPHDVAHTLTALTFGHLSFDLFPERSSWSESAEIQRTMWHLLLRNDAPASISRFALSDPPVGVRVNPPPATPPDARAVQLLDATIKALNERGEARVQLRDLLRATDLDAHICYRWFGDTQKLLDAAHARLLHTLEEPDAERFSLQGRMTRRKLIAHLHQATAELMGRHRRHFRQRRIARLGVTLGRPHLEEVAAYGNTVMLQRLIALYQRWNDEVELDVNPIASGYAAVALSEGFGYLDFGHQTLPGPSALALVESLSAQLSRLQPYQHGLIAGYGNPGVAAQREELATLLSEAEHPTLPEAPKRRSQVAGDQILKLAVEVLTEEGIGALQLSELARRAGMSAANLMYYYPTRDLLIGSLTAHLLEAQRDRWRTILEEVPQAAPDSAARLVEGTLRLAAEPAEAATVRQLSALETGFAPIARARQQQLQEHLEHQLDHFGSSIDHPDATELQTLLKLLRTVADGAASQHAERFDARELQRNLIVPSVALLAPRLQAALDRARQPQAGHTVTLSDGNRRPLD